MDFDVAIFITSNQSILGRVEACRRDLITLGKLELVNLPKVHSQVKLCHGSGTPIEGVEQLLPLVANDHVTTTIPFELVLHHKRLFSKAVRQQSIIDSHCLLFLRNGAQDVIIVYQIKVCHSRVHIFVK